MRTAIGSVVLTAAALAGCSSPRSGYVFLTQLRRDAPPLTSAFELSASFYDIGPPDFEAGTVPGLHVDDAEGGCLLVLDPEPGASFDGGRVEATVGGRALIAHEGVAGPYFESVDDASFDPGTPVTLTVAGGDAVPAAEITLEAPEPPATTLPASIPRDADLTFTWSPELDADVVEVRLDGLVCNVPARAGSVTVAARLLAPLSSGERLLQVVAYRSTEADLDGLPVLFRVGDAVGARVTVE